MQAFYDMFLSKLNTCKNKNSRKDGVLCYPNGFFVEKLTANRKPRTLRG